MKAGLIGWAAIAALAATGAAAQTAPPTPAQAPLVGGPLFLSPMGEPFEGRGMSGAEAWFEKTDANHDGRITPQEMQADAARFFDTLDTDHDGELGPDEILHYETVIAPEIRVGSTYGAVNGAQVDSDGNPKEPPYPTRLGAGRYSWFDMPEPVISADANFDRGVSKQEFLDAALKRLHMLDTDGDGVLTRAELPPLESHGDGEEHRRHGRHRR